MPQTCSVPQSESGGVGLWRTGRTLKKSYQEQKECVHEVYRILNEIIQSPSQSPANYQVSLADIPDHFFSLRKNIFSILFQSTYHLLDLPHERRMLYGKLNHLFRIWVTSADNLLDKEDKVVVPLAMPGRSGVMGQVVAIMAADRALKRVLDDAVADGVINADQARLLADGSLQALLPSAALEGSEEGGIDAYPEPDHVLSTIHLLKTGILFHVPFLGPDLIETSIDGARLTKLKEALLSFGLGCQILDDVRDLSRDLLERRHNYLLSVLEQQKHPVLKLWQQRTLVVEQRLYQEVSEVALPTVRLGLQYLKNSLNALAQLGLGIRPLSVEGMAGSMLSLLDLEDLRYAC